ncbi:hypothetical protein LINPERPRIM_LOCUS20347 [Linum perenne]
MGEDGHGYCRTYGSGVPRNLVYPPSPTSPENSIDVLKSLTETISQFGEKLEAINNRLSSLENKLKNNNEQVLAGISDYEVNGGSFDGEEQNTSSVHLQTSNEDDFE